jgi:hypothetical protein
MFLLNKLRVVKAVTRHHKDIGIVSRISGIHINRRGIFGPGAAAILVVVKAPLVCALHQA